ncbi:MAG: AAA family ATPase [Candidatus Taylorbacteria bacterium]|nr:AAA family ATPase [Candidatus Taylorbacteria bacterium]
MYLKSLEISGFKSFAKKATLSFTSPIASIVGPNGSGKSNVAEAFRFVLGEQSIKSMRGKRGEDLIFNGSAEAGRVNRASVKVVFDNAKRILNIDFDEVTIERLVHRDGINEYLINGSQVRLKDVIELLAGAHIGASGHHIISQGEADRILSANMHERREMIEDALGLKVYHYKKQESIRKLEKTEENMEQVESLRKEIAPHLKFLKKQVEKAEKVREMREELRGLYREYLKREEIYLAREKNTIAKEKAQPAHELARLDKELEHARSVLEKSKNKDGTSNEVIALEKALADIRRERDGYTRELGQIDGEIGALKRVIAKEREQQAREDSKTVYLKDVEEIVRKVDQHIGHSFEKKSVEELQSIFGSIKELLFGFISLHKTTTAPTDKGVTTEAEINKLEDSKKKLTAQSENAEVREKELGHRYAVLKDSIEREKDSNRDAEKEVFRIIARQNEVRSILNTLNGRSERISLEEDAYKRELNEAYILAGREAVDVKSIVVDPHFVEPRQAQEDRKRVLEKLKIRIEDSGTGNADDVLKECKEVEERDAFLEKELTDLVLAKQSLENLIADLDTRLDLEFKEGILKINAQFSHFFSLMFGGGSAELQVIREKKRKKSDTDLSVLLDDEAPLPENTEDEDGREGIEIAVNLPRKKVKSLMMLSGGERALTSIALLFAISQVNPPPFIILDETDAALDEANSRKYGDMIESLAKYSQLILITHNRETMSRAGTLYGVTMGADGGSKLLSIQFDEAVKVAK